MSDCCFNSEQNYLHFDIINHFIISDNHFYIQVGAINDLKEKEFIENVKVKMDEHLLKLEEKVVDTEKIISEFLSKFSYKKT